MKNLMVDIETLGTNNDCPVISIGAVVFDTEFKRIEETFYINLDVSQQIEEMREVDGPTIKWWMNQGVGAKQVFKDEFTRTSEGLCKFSSFYRNRHPAAGKIERVWANGVHFDICILESILNDYGVDIPWKYWDVMDFRTFSRLIAKQKGVKEYYKKKEISHNALEDAISQVRYLLANM